MKNFWILATLITSMNVLAADNELVTNYTSCNMAQGFIGPMIDPNGNLQPGYGQTLKDKRTDGKVETYTFVSPSFANYGRADGKPVESQVTIERDDQGRVIKMVTGGNKVDPSIIKQQKDMMIQMGVQTGLPFDKMIEPQFNLTNKLDKGFSKIVTLSQLTKQDLKNFDLPGWVDIDEIKRLKQQAKHDKKSLKKLQDGYTQLLDKAPIAIPTGRSTEFEIVDGVCRVSKVSERIYDSKSKKVQDMPAVTREACEPQLKIRKKYKAQLASCADVQNMMSQEIMQEQMKSKGGIGNTTYGGFGYGPGGPGGYPVGMGMVGGFGGGGYGQMGGYGFAGDSCEMYFGDFAGGGYVGGSYGDGGQGGAGGGQGGGHAGSGSGQ